MIRFDYEDSKPIVRRWIINYIRAALQVHIIETTNGRFQSRPREYEKGVATGLIKAIGGMIMILSDMDGKPPDKGIEKNFSKFDIDPSEADHEDQALIINKIAPIYEKYIAEALERPVDRIKGTVAKLYEQAGMAIN